MSLSQEVRKDKELRYTEIEAEAAATTGGREGRGGEGRGRK